MKKLAILFTLITTICFVGCTQDVSTVNEDTSENVTTTAEKAEVTPTNSVETSSEVDTNTQTNNTYAEYLGTWLLDSELPYLFTGLQEALGESSITIDHIEGNKVTGSITCISGAPSLRLAEAKFEGELVGNVMKGRYEEDGWLNKGDITLTLSDHTIDATITQDPSEEHSLWGIMVGDFKFVPAIETEFVSLTSLSEDEINHLQERLSYFNADFIEPFTQETLTDAQRIQLIGAHIALGNIYDNEKITFTDTGELSFVQSVMEDLSEKYFGQKVTKHQTVDYIRFEDDKYFIPALGGVYDYPTIHAILKLNDHDDLYFIITNETFQSPDAETADFLGQYVFLVDRLKNPIVLEKIKVEDPLPIAQLVEFIEQVRN